MNKTPPNYRRVKTCELCIYIEYDERDLAYTCSKYGLQVSNYRSYTCVCDSFSTEVSEKGDDD